VISRLRRKLGSIDFNQDLLTQVFTPYPGRITALFAKLGDEVEMDQTLFPSACRHLRQNGVFGIRNGRAQYVSI
jgi:hypothetical protein